MVVNIVFTIKTLELPVDQLNVKTFVLYTPFLLHSIQASQELPDVIFKTWFDKSLRLFHITDLVRFKDTIKESHLDV